jgi:hypothetical protein
MQRTRALLGRVLSKLLSLNYSVLIVTLLASGFIAAGYNLLFWYLSANYCAQYTQSIEITLCNHGMRVLSVLIFLVLGMGFVVMSSLAVVHRLYAFSLPIQETRESSMEWNHHLLSESQVFLPSAVPVNSWSPEMLPDLERLA